MSAPAQNPRPAPVTTIERTSSRATHSSSRSKYRVCNAGVHAFSRSGRFSVSSATPSVISHSTISLIGPPRGVSALETYLSGAGHLTLTGGTPSGT